MSEVIVVGVDGSPESSRAVAWAARQASRTGASVTLVHAIEVPVYAGYGEFAMAMVPPSLTDSQREELRAVITNDWAEPLKDEGIEYSVQLVDGAPATALRAVADAEDAALVVVGRRGRGGFAELVLGSTSHQLTHHIGRPLLIIP